MRDPLTVMRIRRGERRHTFGMVRHHANGKPKAHQGWDLSAAPGTPIYGIADGTVAYAVYHGAYGLQLCLAFSHNGAKKYAFYAHLSTIYVSSGQSVSAGQLVGATGTSGNADGLPAADTHLHFEIRSSPHLRKGLGGREDPGNVLGFGALVNVH